MFYSVDHEVFVGMESLQGVLDTPATQWRQAAVPVEDDDFADMEAGIEEAMPRQQRVFFCVANAKPAQRKVLKGAVGTGNIIRKAPHGFDLAHTDWGR